MNAAVHFLKRCSLIAVMAFALPSAAVTLTLTPVQPVPGPHDICNFAGGRADVNNVHPAGAPPAANGTANDASTYVANDRPGQGQTFLTGPGDAGYLLTDIWVRHTGYTANTAPTWWRMASGGGITVRVTDPSRAGSPGFVIRSETYSTTGTEGWPTSNMNTQNGDNMWLHFRLDAPVLLEPNTTYGFDLTAVFNLNAFFEWLGNSTNVYAGGHAYRGDTTGAPDTACVPLQGDRVFLLELTPAAPPALTAEPVSPAELRVSWPASDAGFMLRRTHALHAGESWTTSGLPAPASDGLSNYVVVPMTQTAEFYRLAAPKTFALDLSPNSLVITQGLQSVARISITPLNGFTNNVGLSVGGVPADLAASLVPPSLPDGDSLLLLDAGTAAPGTHQLTVTGVGGFTVITTNLTVAVVADTSPPDAPYVWPPYIPDLNYNFTNEFPSIAAPSNILNDCSGVTTTVTLPDNWFAFRFGGGKHSLVTSNAWIPMLERLNEEFIYFRNILGWPPDKRAKRGYYSSVYLLGSGTCVGGNSNDLGGWQGNIHYQGEDWPMVLLSYYPVYCFDPACPYPDREFQKGAVVHEAIHAVLADMPGCKQACWFHEGGNTWLQGTADAQRSGNYSSMGWLSAGAMLAPFMPIECYSGWLQDDSFGGPCAEGVNMFTNGTQICTWRRLLGGTQYGETFAHFMGEIVSPGSVAWIWRNCLGRVLEGLATAPGGLGPSQTRRLIQEYRARQAMCDFGKWSNAYKKLLHDNWGSSIGPEWSPYWIDSPPWIARCYVITTNQGGTLIPEWRTLPGWSGANQIPLTTASPTGNITVQFTPLSTNMSCQLVYRATDNSVVYSKPVSSGACTLTPPPDKPIKNNVVIAVICNTDYRYLGEASRKHKYDYRLTITGPETSGILGTANISTKWWQ
ncbi:MAG TPA: hypothetical protein PLK78_02760 [Verrucomicrobiota bacterium]|nr:hypothetical protein [Verrucomicrobiota bacterium]